ncbi:TIGR01244 family sulfur transferase [Caulobacter sp. KR2-114]|uniref:TIGR01244 family sulfur transferase n=1 Tax=Caulobacter sp. KR2-114 TaxID=3400912 RepID=UPI003C0644FC
MSEFRTVTDDFAVSPQIAPTDVASAAAQGFRLIINNRPDGEQPGQPTSAEIEAQAKAHGLAYVHIPVVGRPSVEQAKATRDAAAAAGGKVLAFCRSGTRSITAWSMGQAAAGDRPVGDLVALGANAGYDLSGVLGG